jgi:branched-chain amino acid transport system substrate-binding protein
MKIHSKIKIIILCMLLFLSCTSDKNSQTVKRGSEDGDIVIGVVCSKPNDIICLTNQAFQSLLNRFFDHNHILQELFTREDKNTLCIDTDNMTVAQKDAIGKDALNAVMEYSSDSFFVNGISLAVDEINNKRFNLTEQSLKNLESHDVPSDILTNLKPMLNQLHSGEEAFSDAVKKRIGQNEFAKYKNLILRFSSGIIGGRKIKLLFKYNDEKISSLQLKREQKIAKEFASNQDVVAVISHEPSEAAIPVSITYEYNGIIFIATKATNPVLTNNDFRFVFRTVPSDIIMGNELAQYVLRQKVEKVIILNVINVYAQELADHFQEQAVKRGITIAARRSYAQELYNNDFKPLLSSIKQDFTFDMIFLSDTALVHGKEVIEQSRIMDITQPFIGGVGLDAPNILSLIEKDAEGTVVPTVFNPCKSGIPAEEFNRKFLTAYRFSPDTQAAQGYDAINLLASAFEETGSTDAVAVASRLKYSTKKWEGINGPYAFNSKGDLVDQTWYKLSEQSLENLKLENLQAGVIAKLAKMKNIDFPGLDSFLDNIIEALGEDAGFRITDSSLEQLVLEKVPPETIKKLETIKDQLYVGEDKFIEIIKQTIKAEQTYFYKSNILKNTYEHKEAVLKYAEKDKKEIYFKVFKNGRFEYVSDGLAEKCE